MPAQANFDPRYSSGNRTSLFVIVDRHLIVFCSSWYIANREYETEGYYSQQRSSQGDPRETQVLGLLTVSMNVSAYFG